MATPSSTLPVFRAIFNRKIGDDVICVTTTTAGSSGKNTAVSTAFIEHRTPSGGGDSLVGRYLFVPSVNEERKITKFDPVTGTAYTEYPFSAQVADKLPIEVHRHSIADKMNLINDGLDWVSLRGHYFNPSYGETLWGQEEYGEDTAEFNKRLYSIPTAFKEFPKIWLVEGYTGTHTGADAAAALTDSTKNWTTNELAGLTIYNKTDGSSIAVTSNTDDDVVGTLAGGTGDEWDEDDEYIVQKPDAIPFSIFDLENNQFEQTQKSKLGGFEFYARIPETYLIKLEGKGPLTLFTNEASTTELYVEQVKVVALKCAALWFEWLLDRVGTQDKATLQDKANRMHAQYADIAGEARMPAQEHTIPIRRVTWK